MTILALLLAATALAPTDGKVEATDDWVGLSILAVGSAAQSPYYLRVAAGDLDGDGLADEAYLRLTCAGNALQAVHYNVKSPRDSASGLATGKRMHKPITFVKEWGAATPMLSAVKPTYNVKNMEGSRVAGDGWSPMALAHADGLCPATEAAARKATKTKSNIQNN